MAWHGGDYGTLVGELRAAIAELRAAVGEGEARWSAGPRGRWTAGQHLEHVAIALERSAAPFEAAALAVRSGAPPRRPRRGPLQAAWVALLTRAQYLPSGMRTPPPFEAQAAPDRAATERRLEEQTERLIAVGAALEPPAREELWIRNPFREQWQYTYPEMLRVQAVHTRHHTRLVRQAVTHAGRAPGT